MIRINQLTLTNKKLEKEALLKIGEEYANNIFQTNLSAINSEVSFYKNALEHPEVSSYSEAEYLKIPMAVNFKDIPIMYKNSHEYPFFVTLDIAGNVSTLSFTPSVVAFDSLNEKTLISIDQAVENINNNQATIISAGVSQAASIELEEIIGGNLNKYQLEYRVDETTSYIIPYYRFSGEVQNLNEELYTVEIITPAVKTQ